MRIDRTNEDAFAKLFKAGKPRKPRKRGKAPATVPSPDLADESLDETIPAGTRLYKDQRERQLDAIKEEDRRAKRARELQQRRFDRVSREVQGFRRYFKTLEKAEPTLSALAYDDADVDLATLARGLGLAEIQDDYDRFQVVLFSMAVVKRVAKRAGYTEHAPEDYFSIGRTTCIDELKEALRVT